MKPANSQLIDAAEQAKRLHGKNSHQYATAHLAVLEVQAACRHERTKTICVGTSSKLFQEGDDLEACLDCAIPLAVNGKPWKRPDASVN